MTYLDDLLSEEEVSKPISAARLVAQALAADSGRRKKTNYWVSVTRPVFGEVRITSKMWEEVLSAGVAEGLFKVDTKTLDYPILVLSKGKPLIEILANPEPEPPKEPKPTLTVPPPAQTVKNPNPMEFLACGHWNWQDVPKLPEECTPQEVARLKANPENRSVTIPYKTIRFTDSAECWKCAQGKGPDSFQRQQDGHQTPVPASIRRTRERELGKGWPGLCVDSSTGFYIGGLGNDCRRYSSGRERCDAHRPKLGVSSVEEPE